MAIVNVGSGGSRINLKVVLSNNEPVTSNNMHVLWVKDSLDFLNLYENDEVELPLTEIIGYKNAAKEETKNATGTMFVVDNPNDNKRYLHLDVQYHEKSIQYFPVVNAKPYWQIQVPAKTGLNDANIKNKLYVGYCDDSTPVEGSLIYNVREVEYDYDAATKWINVPYEEGIYKCLCVCYDLNQYVPKAAYPTLKARAYPNADYTGTKSEKTASVNRGNFIENCIMADINGDYLTYYFKTEPNKAYKLYPNGNLYNEPFYITEAGVGNTKIPSEGNLGLQITEDMEGVYFYSPLFDKDYYFIPGNETITNICFTCEKNITNKPYIVEATSSYDIHMLAMEGKTLTNNYDNTGYTISSFEPEGLFELSEQMNTEKNLLKTRLWIVAGKNEEVNFEGIKSATKNLYLSLEGVTCYLPHPKHDKAGLYFLHAQIALAGTHTWIPLKENMNSLFNLEALLEGTLDTIYYDLNESLRDYAFFNYNDLIKIDMPNCESIGYSAFYNCHLLKTVNLPMWDINTLPPTYFSGNKSANDTSPFAKCSQITTANIGWTSFANGGISSTLAYNKRALSSATSPFYSASNTLHTLILPNCETIGNATFAYYDGLETIEFKSTNSPVVTLGSFAFFSCNNLSKIKNSTSIKEIYNYAFKNCISLSEINLEKVQKIYTGAFENCNKLQDIFIDEENQLAVEEIGQSAFHSTSISVINAPSCSIFGYMKTANNKFSGYAKTSMPIANCGLTLSWLTLGWENGTTALGNYFSGSTKANQATFFNNLASISFSKITAIANGAFLYVSNLSNITLSPALSTLPNNAFMGCAKIVKETINLLEFDHDTYEFDYEYLKYGAEGIVNDIAVTYPKGPKKYIQQDTAPESGDYYLSEGKYYIETGEVDESYNNTLVYDPIINPETDEYKFIAKGLDDAIYYIMDYDTTKPITNYYNIKYAEKIVTQNEEEQNDDTYLYVTVKAEDKYKVYYTRNNRIKLAEEENYESEYDDWVYKHLYYKDNDEFVTDEEKIASFVFNECYYKPVLDQLNRQIFAKADIENCYIINQGDDIITIEIKEDENEEIVIDKILKNNIEINNISNHDNPIYAINKLNPNKTLNLKVHNSAPTLTKYRRVYNELLGNYTYTSNGTIDIIDSNSDYFYEYEQTNNYVGILDTDGTTCYIKEYDWTKPVYTEIKNIPRAQKDDYSKPKVAVALYNTAVDAMLRIRDDSTHKPEINEKFQLILTTTDNYHGIKYINKWNYDVNLSRQFTSGGCMEGLITVGENCFTNCFNLKEVHADLGNPAEGTVYTLGKLAFSNCTNLEIVNMPYCTIMADSTIANFPFSKCANLKSLNLSNIKFNNTENKNVINNLFYSYNATSTKIVTFFPSLENVILNNIIGISSSAFYGYSCLSNAIFNNCATVSKYAFYSNAFGYIGQSSDLKTFNNDEKTWLIKEDLATFIEEKAFEIMNVNKCSYILQIPNVTFRNTDTYVFAYCKNLMGGYINKMNVVPEGAFENCISLTEVVNDLTFNKYNCLYLPGITIIDKKAFLNCNNITKVDLTEIFSDEHNKLTAINEYAFYGCNALKNIYLPDTLTTIGISAFYPTNITSEIKNVYFLLHRADGVLPTLPTVENGTPQEAVFGQALIYFDSQETLDFYKALAPAGYIIDNFRVLPEESENLTI